jgi:hypothetical protein
LDGRADLHEHGEEVSDRPTDANRGKTAPVAGSERVAPEPVASRPHMPGYGIAAEDAGQGLLPWAWAVEHLEQSHNYWLASTTPSGAPHLAAVWALWCDGALHFSTSGRSRKADNLRHEPRCVMSTERADESVVVEGTAVPVTEPARLDLLLGRYTAKYGSGFPDPEANPVFALEPRVVFGIIEREDEFSETATRWTF